MLGGKLELGQPGLGVPDLGPMVGAGRNDRTAVARKAGRGDATVRLEHEFRLVGGQRVPKHRAIASDGQDAISGRGFERRPGHFLAARQVEIRTAGLRDFLPCVEIPAADQARGGRGPLRVGLTTRADGQCAAGTGERHRRHVLRPAIELEYLSAIRDVPQPHDALSRDPLRVFREGQHLPPVGRQVHGGHGGRFGCLGPAIAVRQLLRQLTPGGHVPLGDRAVVARSQQGGAVWQEVSLVDAAGVPFERGGRLAGSAFHNWPVPVSSPE